MYKILLTLLLLIFNVFAASHCLRDGAAGSNNGTDWTNAWEDITDVNWTTFARGDTLYVADGTYSGIEFDDAVSGSTINYILKATGSEHGTETGWSAGYGDGVANFYEIALGNYTGVIEFSTSYWYFDGKTGSDSTGHGFQISTDDADGASRALLFSGTISNITIRHTDMSHSGEGGLYNSDVVYCNSTVSYVTIDSCYLHDVTRNIITFSGGNHWTLEHSFLQRNWNDEGIHQQIIQGGPAVTNNFIIRYNTFKDGNGTGYVVPLGGTAHRYWYVYGNLFYVTNPSRYLCPSGLFGDTSTTQSDSMYFFNNTIVDIDDPTSYDAGVDFNYSGANEILVYNNFWYNCNLGDWSNVTDHDYNAADVDLGEAHDQLISSSSIFNNYNNDDFTLSGATDIGTSLSSPYNYDKNGNLRGADGIWDRGFYEYYEGQCGDAQIYYVSNRGNNDSCGTTPNTALYNFDSLDTSGKGITLDKGDIVAIFTGDTIYDSFTPLQDSIVITSFDSGTVRYGLNCTGPRPVLSAGDTISGGWANQGGSVWRKNVGSTAPLVVVFNGDTLGKVDATPDSKFEWTYSNPNLDVYATSNPSSYYSKVEYGQRSIIIDLVGRNNITVENVHGYISNSNGFRATDADSIRWDNVKVNFCWVAGLIFYDTGGSDYDSSMTIINNEFCYNGQHGIGSGQYYKDVLIQGNSIHHNGQDGADAFNGGLYMWDDIKGTSYGFIVQYNAAYYNGYDYAGIKVASPTGGYGLWTDTQGSNSGADPIIFRCNYTYGNAHTGIYLENTPDAQAYYNTSYNDSSGIRVATSDASYYATNCLVYNNTIYNSGDYGLHIGDANTNGTIVKNNVVHKSGTNLIFHENATNTILDDNLYFDKILTNKFNWNGSTYSTFADYQSASSQDVNSFNLNPLFINTTLNDFRLKASSPCIDAGTDVGLSYDIEDNPIVRLPDIGAYEYQGLRSNLLRVIDMKEIKDVSN